MAKVDINYHKLLTAILDTGYAYRTSNRPDIEMKQITSSNMEIDLDEFPVLTTKKIYWKGVVTELIWFLRGDNNIKFLVDNNVNIWNKDAHNYEKRKYPNQLDFGVEEFVEGVKEGFNAGYVGKNYGVQWRNFHGEDTHVDQIETLIENLRKPNPISRRHIVTAWNPAELDQTALPPCHWAFEVLPRPLSIQHKIKYSGGDKEYLEALWNAAYIKNDKDAKETLDKELEHVPEYGFVLKWHQRSVDTFLGLPFNIASYALLAGIISAFTDMIPLSLIGDLSNVHVYGPHTDAVRKQLKNSPLAYDGPQLMFSEGFSKNVERFKKREVSFNHVINNLTHEDFILMGYKSFSPIKAEMYEPKV